MKEPQALYLRLGCVGGPMKAFDKNWRMRPWVAAT
jgi:hypothetical protein